MEEILDIVWFKMVDGIAILVELMDLALAPLHPLGPAALILILALATVCFTKWFSSIYTTRRYEALKKEFNHWFNLRKEALACSEKEKGKLLAKNIDQAKLNKAYYDYFFEGFLNNILTTYLPVVVMASYINESFRQERLLSDFNMRHVFTLPGSGEVPVAIGGLFWFVISLIAIHLTWFLARRATSGKDRVASSQTAPLPASPQSGSSR